MSDKLSKNSNQHPSPALMERILNSQEQQLVIRDKEIDLQKQIDRNTHDYAKAALEVEAKDKESERVHKAIMIKLRYIFAGIIIVCLFSLFGFALYLNKDQIVMEIIKAIMYFGAGGFGGYYYSEGKKSKDNN